MSGYAKTKKGFRWVGPKRQRAKPSKPEKPTETHRLLSAYKEGFACGSNPQSGPDENPYRGAKNKSLADQWIKGWIEAGEKLIANKTKP